MVAVKRVNRQQIKSFLLNSLKIQTTITKVLHHKCLQKIVLPKRLPKNISSSKNLVTSVEIKFSQAEGLWLAVVRNTIYLNNIRVTFLYSTKQSGRSRIFFLSSYVPTERWTSMVDSIRCNKQRFADKFQRNPRLEKFKITPGTLGFLFHRTSRYVLINEKALII